MPRINLAVIALTICGAALIALFVLGMAAQGNENLFFACPQVNEAVSIEKADETEAKLTYEIVDTVRVKAAVNIDARQIGTNHFYNDIMGYAMTSGSFFTLNAQQEKRKVAVLNETLAMESFGTFDIAGNQISLNNEMYVIVGVIKDNKEETAVYVPAILTNTSISNFIEVIETEEETLANLKSLGVSQNSFYLANLGEFAKVIKSKFALAWWLIALVVSCFLSIKGVKVIGESVRKVKRLYKEEYLGEVIKSCEVQKIMLFAIGALMGIGIGIYAMLQSAQIFLSWSKYANALEGISTLAFGGKISALQKLSLYSDSAFAFFIGGVGIGIIGAFRHKQNV